MLFLLVILFFYTIFFLNLFFFPRITTNITLAGEFRSLNHSNTIFAPEKKGREIKKKKRQGKTFKTQIAPSEFLS